jgi:hypothetical protein
MPACPCGSSPNENLRSAHLLSVISSSFYSSDSRWLIVGLSGRAKLPQRARGGVAMKLKCVECGRFTLKLNVDNKCVECARKDEKEYEYEYMKRYVVKLDFLNENYTR